MKKDISKAVRRHLDILEKLAGEYPEYKKEIIEGLAILYNGLRHGKKKS